MKVVVFHFEAHPMGLEIGVTKDTRLWVVTAAIVVLAIGMAIWSLVLTSSENSSGALSAPCNHSGVCSLPGGLEVISTDGSMSGVLYAHDAQTGEVQVTSDRKAPVKASGPGEISKTGLEGVTSFYLRDPATKTSLAYGGGGCFEMVAGAGTLLSLQGPYLVLTKWTNNNYNASPKYFNPLLLGARGLSGGLTRGTPDLGHYYTWEAEAQPEGRVAFHCKDGYLAPCTQVPYQTIPNSTKTCSGTTFPLAFSPRPFGWEVVPMTPLFTITDPEGRYVGVETWRFPGSATALETMMLTDEPSKAAIFETNLAAPDVFYLAKTFDTYTAAEAGEDPPGHFINSEPSFNEAVTWSPLRFRNDALGEDIAGLLPRVNATSAGNNAGAYFNDKYPKFRWGGFTEAVSATTFSLKDTALTNQGFAVSAAGYSVGNDTLGGDAALVLNLSARTDEATLTEGAQVWTGHAFTTAPFGYEEGFTALRPHFNNPPPGIPLPPATAGSDAIHSAPALPAIAHGAWTFKDDGSIVSTGPRRVKRWTLSETCLRDEHACSNPKGSFHLACTNDPCLQVLEVQEAVQAVYPGATVVLKPEDIRPNVAYVMATFDFASSTSPDVSGADLLIVRAPSAGSGIAVTPASSSTPLCTDAVTLAGAAASEVNYLNRGLFAVISGGVGWDIAYTGSGEMNEESYMNPKGLSGAYALPGPTPPAASPLGPLITVAEIQRYGEAGSLRFRAHAFGYPFMTMSSRSLKGVETGEGPDLETMGAFRVYITRDKTGTTLFQAQNQAFTEKCYASGTFAAKQGKNGGGADLPSIAMEADDYRARSCAGSAFVLIPVCEGVDSCTGMTSAGAGTAACTAARRFKGE